ncbi:MAG TPA: P-loop NTPase, partial [Tepidisphaeraceae bacterium]
MSLSQEQILAALRTVKDPELYKDIVTLGMVKHAEVRGQTVHLRVELTTRNGPVKDVVERDVRRALADAGATQVQLDVSAPAARPATAAGGQPGHPSHGPLPQVRNVIAVGAGKGGVGKSPLAVHLAVGLQRGGARVGLMDGDIYGPSMPTMLGIKGRQPELRGNKIIPAEKFGLKVISMG